MLEALHEHRTSTYGSEAVRQSLRSRSRSHHVGAELGGWGVVGSRGGTLLWDMFNNGKWAEADRTQSTTITTVVASADGFSFPAWTLSRSAYNGAY